MLEPKCIQCQHPKIGHSARRLKCPAGAPEDWRGQGYAETTYVPDLPPRIITVIADDSARD